MDQDPIQLNRESYDQIASLFAAKVPAMDDRLIARATRFIQAIEPGDRILDLGCGTGRDLAWFTANGVQAIGADLSIGMLSEAKQITKSRLCQMEMRNLGFASQSFAAVWCNAALLHLPKIDAPKALSEVFRVLVPGGRFYISLQKGSGEGPEDNPNVTVLRYYSRYEPQEAELLLNQAGFTIIGQDEYEFGRIWLWFETIRGRV